MKTPLLAYQIRAALEAAPPQRKPLAERYPETLAVDYVKFLREIVRDYFNTLTNEVMYNALSAARRGDSARYDAPKTAAQIIEAAVEIATRRLSVRGPEARMASIVKDANQKSRQAFRKNVKSYFGVDVFGEDPDLDLLAKQFVARNVALITGDFAPNIVAKIRNAVYAGAASGATTAQLASELREIRRGLGARAELIARDQVAKLYSQITAERHVKNGIEAFLWVASHDKKVRPLHRQIDGEKYYYRRGGHPTEGLPGTPVRCRCTQQPVFDNLWKRIQDL